ncbi:hypothetical protein KDA_61820 [Dictyobacter alpinus]|uniref:Uncharacterized protein n=2 Tax=Dictyobacter alpinus TaxID=2014873 RepID=A0A402BGY9_9CHLR|nr:hypothetical protein KDA_61820 [Dictyobacter alpinus]
MDSAVATSTPAVTATKVLHFVPTGIRSGDVSAGDCWVTSLAAPRNDAWRCMVDSVIYDPCFSSPAQKDFVLCDASPAGNTNGIKVKLTSPLPASTAENGDGKPWVLHLSNGAYCTFMTGATSLVGDERVNYACTDNALIPGFPKEGTVWTVHVLHDGQKDPVTTTVLQAWT